MTTYIIYKTLITTYQRLGRDTAPLALKIDTTYAMGAPVPEWLKKAIAALKDKVDESAEVK